MNSESTTAAGETLTLFYDGYCPLCVAEMKMLAELDKPGRLRLVDITAADFEERFPHVDRAEANRILHAQWSDGRMIYGLDVTHQAWKVVGKKPWLAILRWPIVRWFADLAYLGFAYNRYSISWLLTGQRRCESCRLSADLESR
jgi:predicted DCC family thiol-disulfide oxidoreductase YuxK